MYEDSRKDDLLFRYRQACRLGFKHTAAVLRTQLPEYMLQDLTALNATCQVFIIPTSDTERRQRPRPHRVFRSSRDSFDLSPMRRLQ